jgi:AAA15 family ATPase/GTPase
MQYSDIRIEQFRSIERLDLEDFSRINLFTGKNNCGKTTILEALFILSGMSNPQLPVTINNLRDLVLTSDDDFRYIFYNLDFANEPYIEASLDKVKRTLRIKPSHSSVTANLSPEIEQKKIIDQSLNVSTSNIKMPVNGLILEFTNKNPQQKYTSVLSLTQPRFVIPNDYAETLHCAFQTPQNTVLGLDKRLENIIVDKKVNDIIEIIREIEPQVSDIRMGANGMIYLDIGIQKLIPLNILGDGIRRILSLIAAAIDMKNGILLIDEIENGFHFSSLKVLWKALLKTSKAYDVQIFATTHSYECIAALSEESKGEEDIRLYRIEKKNGHHKALTYSSEMVRSGIENRFEVR